MLHRPREGGGLMRTTAVIIDMGGKFLASAWFATGGAVRARWVSEYPDAAEFLPGEAIRTARKLIAAGVDCEAVENYGNANERTSLSCLAGIGEVTP